MKQRVLLLLVFISFLFIDLSAQSQSWIVKDSILVFPQGYSNWLKRNNGGVDSANPGPGNFSNKFGVGTNQGVDLFDFNHIDSTVFTLSISHHSILFITVWL